jgi:hypothetical protein
VKESAAEAPEVEQALGGAVEGNAHPVEQEDDARCCVAHALDGRLVGEEVPAVNGLLEVDLRRVALALGVDARVDAALRAHRVRALDRDEGEQVHRDPGLAELDDGHQPGEPASHDDDPADFSGLAPREGLRCGHVSARR